MTLVEELTDKLSYPTGSTLKKTHDSLNYTEGYIDCLKKAIGIVEAHSDWTPVSKPPKTDDDILISVVDLEDDNYRFVCKGNYYPGEHYWSSSELYGGCNIEAWQPLPKPCEGE